MEEWDERGKEWRNNAGMQSIEEKKVRIPSISNNGLEGLRLDLFNV